MYLYYDLISGDEMFSDAFPIVEFKKAFYKVKSKMIVEGSGISDALIGGNASAETPDESDVADCETKVDAIQSASKLEQTQKFCKKSFKAYFKKYSKSLLVNIKEDQKAEFMEDMKEALKYLLTRVEELDVFTGKSNNNDGTLAFKDYEEDGISYYYLYIKYGVRKEKC